MGDKSGFTKKEVEEYLGSRRHMTFHRRDSAVAKIECIHCGQPFDPILATASHLGLCNYCFDKH